MKQKKQIIIAFKNHIDMNNVQLSFKLENPVESPDDLLCADKILPKIFNTGYKYCFEDKNIVSIEKQENKIIISILLDSSMGDVYVE
ncbi:hypothetical protein [Flavonifractor sp. An10]|uniref:hypothetical protein n=1 Tax=Flavonifractor sp. An10 TaxID=1965537 RepID=UPI000B3779D4|nr:hypothetical protein [Flavonifractor sp. An10]OUQ81396.1 hypothetical protein B5E42_12080 [Flavonifractor sp. An10]